MKRYLIILVAVAALSAPAFAQQTGSVSGTVTMDDGSALPGVTVTATGEVLPQPRVAVSDGNGDYRLPLLPPGAYELTFELEGVATQKRALEVELDIDTTVDVAMPSAAVTDIIEVVSTTPVVDLSSTELKSAITKDVIEALPIGQEYRDLIKLAPGIQYTEDTVRGPSAGGSGQDNVYLFDGANVGLPLFGTLSAEPASYDIAQVSFVKGGARAQDFNRSGGFTINSVSRSGTNRWRGLVSYQIQSSGMTGDRDVPESEEVFDEDKDWITLGIGGPLLRDKLYFYGSYYRPTVGRNNRDNVYGPVPDFDSTRDEFFGKLTWTPTSSLLLNGSYRDSDRTEDGAGVCDTCSGENSQGNEATLAIGILEGSWLISDRSSLSFKYTDFENKTGGIPDNLLGFQIGPGVDLDVNNLNRQGEFSVPLLREDDPLFNFFAGPLIQQYGFIGSDGARQGGGTVGPEDQINRQDFFREEFNIGYDHLLAAHQLHFGVQWYEVSEELLRRSNGWGQISLLGGGETTTDGQPIIYRGRFLQQSLSNLVPPTVSSFESWNLEVNDVISWRKWTFNVGFVFSNDTYFGQGLRERSGTVSGFELAPGNKYEMYDIGFGETISPRLGAVWSWNGRDTAYASFARYYPAVSSLARAASWDRNISSRILDAAFDADGNFLEIEPLESSSGKVFQDGLDPRYIDEYIVGYSKQISTRWIGRTHLRHRRGRDFWEDTNNNARLVFDPPPGIPRELYVPNLDEIRAEIGGSSYVIAELDDAFTDYYEVNLEGEYRSPKWYFKGTYVWSQYYGTFDQDNTTTENDDAIFVGSSNLADGAGRQIWDFKYGYLRGDRRYQAKAYGFYNFNWNGSAGAFFIFQDGQPWEEWNVLVYRDLTGSSSDTNRYAEPAGSRRTDSHFQLDLNYTHNFPFASRYNFQVRLDLFNVFDEQTGYNIQNKFNTANFGVPRDFFNPRRLQLAVKLEF
jgi:hypothetical protein